MIVSAVPGRTNVKIVIDADHPLPLNPVSSVPVNLRLANGNMHGPYSTADTSRMNQIPSQVSLVSGSTLAADLFVATELHEENDMHRLFLSRLQQSDPNWDLAEGDGGNHLLLRPSLYTATGVSTMMPGNRSMSDFTVTDKATGQQVHVLAAHLRADDSDGKSRRSEREQEIKFLAQYAVGLKHVILAGDFNFETSQIAKLRGILASAGLYGLQTRQPGLPNGDKDSYSGAATGRWIDDVFTRMEQSVAGAAGVVAGAAADHYLWQRATVGFVVESSAPKVRLSLYRDSGEGRVLVPGMQDVVAETTVVTDHTAPLNRDLVYVAALNNGTTVQAPAVQLASDLPLLTHPVTGSSTPVIVQDWPDRSRETPSTLVKVPGRRSPVVLADVETMATSSPVLLTKTREAERGVEGLVAGGDVLLLRTTYPEVGDAFLAVTQRQVGRVSQFRGRSTARLHTLASQEIGVEDMREPGRGDTLGDLAGAMPLATLADLAALFPGGVLLDIAANDWKGAGLVPVIPPTPPSSNAVFPSASLFPSDTTYPGA